MQYNFIIIIIFFLILTDEYDDFENVPIVVVHGIVVIVQIIYIVQVYLAHE